MSDQLPPEGEPVRLAPPFEKITVQYPFHWAQPNRVHVFDEKDGNGTVYGPEWARALAEGILTAMDGPGHWTPEGEAI
jgi:hypothetical protein